MKITSVIGVGLLIVAALAGCSDPNTARRRGAEARGADKAHKEPTEAKPAPAPAPALKMGGRSGVYDVPLPAGAVLTERVEADPDMGVDQRESYTISATADEIKIFFRTEMPKAGWVEAAGWGLSFDKGTIGVVIASNPKGGSFTVMGGDSGKEP